MATKENVRNEEKKDCIQSLNVFILDHQSGALTPRHGNEQCEAGLTLKPPITGELQLIFEDTFDTNDFDKSKWTNEISSFETQPLHTTLAQSTGTCENKISDCADFGADVCTAYRVWINKNCQKYCNFCQELGISNLFPEPTNTFVRSGVLHLKPAIWLMPKEEHYGGWPMSGEIDMVETSILQLEPQ
ncbi:unnamed protein product [Mytilus edulis]|uniref:ShKT domain-containing protein n=1 Tax=Mytilus edulis TaxID=6550 RepID=A0A8S3TVV9_MYTED|nr:unnamed protein product [Mytilus edulis]